MLGHKLILLDATGKPGRITQSHYSGPNTMRAINTCSLGIRGAPQRVPTEPDKEEEEEEEQEDKS